MDPHSRLSQYNQRLPKAGPHLQNLRQMEPKTTAVFEQFVRRSTFSKSKENVKDLAAFTSRPIATNARVKRDEKYRRDVYLAFIQNALSEKEKGFNEHYDDLVRQFDPRHVSAEGQTTSTQLRSYITALSHVVSKLDNRHKTLVDAIVSMPWTTMDSAFVKAYISFLGMLVSARPEYLGVVLERAAQALTYQSGKIALSCGFAESSASPLTRRVMYDRVHNLLQQLLALVPTLPTTLYPLLARNFPHKRQTQTEHVTYIRNLLRLSDYCPELWDRVLGLIVDRTIQIDVEIQVELEELEAEGPLDSGEVFHLDVFDVLIGQEGEDSESGSDEDSEGDENDISSDAESVDSDANPREEARTNTKQVQSMVTKLDSILEVVFKHLQRLHTAIETDTEPERDVPSEVSSGSQTPTRTPWPPSPFPLERRKALRESRFFALLSIFERTILRTFKSRYTQFLLFWYSSLDNQFRDRFLGTVISKALLEHDLPVVTRAAAASYVASYVSRAQFVDRVETRSVVRIICGFLESHLDSYDACVAAAPTHAGGALVQSREQHAVFYAATQAVFLIFCFRWRDLMENDEGEDEFATAIAGGAGAQKLWMAHLSVIQRLVNSPLNPLKVCSNNIVQQFARVAQRVGFVYCYSILEANRRSQYFGHANGSSGANAPQHHTRHLQTSAMREQFDADLTTFFPFDPFRLPRSGVFIDGIYREWSSVAIEDSGDEEEYSDVDDEDDEDEDEDNEEAVDGVYEMRDPASLKSDDAGRLGESFGGMSISPALPRQMRPATEEDSQSL